MDEVIKSLTKTLELVSDAVKNNLVLIGSVNQRLQGVAKITPKKDIDLATNYSTVIGLIDLFKKDSVNFCKDKNGNDSLPFAHLFINVEGIEVEFFDAIDFGASNYKGYLSKENLINLNINGNNLKGLNLQSEMEVCQKVGKIEKANAIREFINP